MKRLRPVCRSCGAQLVAGHKDDPGYHWEWCRRKTLCGRLGRGNVPAAGIQLTETANLEDYMTGNGSRHHHRRAGGVHGAALARGAGVTTTSTPDGVTTVTLGDGRRLSYGPASTETGDPAEGFDWTRYSADDEVEAQDWAENAVRMDMIIVEFEAEE